METLELPVTEEREETPAAPVSFAEQEMDIAAFRLWQDASRLIVGEDEDSGEPRPLK
jgi:hypothetical protein